MAPNPRNQTTLPGAVARFTMLVSNRLKELNGTDDPLERGIRQGLTEAGSLMLEALAADQQSQEGGH